jgi:hypothetical protein
MKARRKAIITGRKQETTTKSKAGPTARILVPFFVSCLSLCIWWLISSKFKPTTESMPIYGINVPRRKDRRAAFLARFNGTAPVVVDAVDGSLLNSFGNSTLTIGEHACFMSHIKALSIAIDKGHDQFLILEDDALLFFPEHFPAIQRIQDQAPSDWGAISLAANHLPTSAVNVGHELYLLGGSDLYGAQAVIYKRKWAQVVLRQAVSNPISVPWDLWLSRVMKSNLYVKYPSLAPPRDISDSDTLRSHLDHPSSFRDPEGFFERSKLPVLEQINVDTYRLDARDTSCVDAVRKLHDSLENRIGPSVDTCRMILTVKSPAGEEWDTFLKMWSLTAMNTRTNMAERFLFSGSSREHGLFFIAMRG